MTNEYYHPKKIAFKDGTHAWVFDDEGGGRMPATSREIAFSERIAALEAQLEAVRQIRAEAEQYLYNDYGQCALCFREISTDGHAEYCPMTRLDALLEEAYKAKETTDG